MGRTTMKKCLAAFYAMAMLFCSTRMLLHVCAGEQTASSEFGGKKYYGTVKYYLDGQFAGITKDCGIVIVNADAGGMVVPAGDFKHLFDPDQEGFDAYANRYGIYEETPSIALDGNISYDPVTNQGSANGLIGALHYSDRIGVYHSYEGDHLNWSFTEEGGEKKTSYRIQAANPFLLCDDRRQ